MLEFQLFRVKVFLNNQTDLFDNGQPNRKEYFEEIRIYILQEILGLSPILKLGNRGTWSIGNVSNFDSNGYYFRFGKSTRKTRGQYQSGNFEDVEGDDAPYTHVLLDTALEVLAIAKKTSLSPRTTTIANYLKKVLNVPNSGVSYVIEISEITDPEDLIEHVNSAFLVSKLWLTFAKPNPFDAEEDFIKPQQRLLNELGGKEGKTEVVGASLEKSYVTELIRSSAATGDDAGIKYKPTESSAYVSKSLSGRSLSISIDDSLAEDGWEILAGKIRALYFRIRGRLDS